jgi:sugar lactone lactonase YvrE
MKRFVTHLMTGLAAFGLAACVTVSVAVAGGYQYAGTWGSHGTADGQFDGMGGIAVDSSGNVYLSDTGNKRIQKFSSSGAFLAKWATPDGAVDGLAVDRSGTVYAADYWNARILRFGANGGALAPISTTIPADWESEPHSVAVDSAGNVIVTDSSDHLVKKFSAGGAYLGALGAAGNGPGQFARPIGVAVDTADNVYVVDYENYNVQKFGSNGTYFAGHTTICSGDANLLYPVSVTVDGGGNIYVADRFVSTLIGDGSVKRFDSSFLFQTRIGTYSSSPALPGTYCVVAGVAVAPSGTVYVADSTFDRVVEFASASGQATTTTIKGPSSAKVNKTLTLSGTVSPSGAAGSVKILKTRKVGSKWKSAGSATVALRNGVFKYGFKPKLKGSWRFVAKYSGGGGYASSASGTKAVKVK